MFCHRTLSLNSLSERWMIYVIFSSVILLLVAIILFPDEMNALVYRRIPPEARIDASRHVPVSSIALFMFSVFLFYNLHKAHPLLLPTTANRQSLVSQYIAGVFFFSCGLFCCVRPVQSLKRLIWQLRKTSSATIESNRFLVRFAKLAGIIQLVGASYYLYRIVE